MKAKIHSHAQMLARPKATQPASPGQNVPLPSGFALLALTLVIMTAPVRADITYTLQFDPASSPEAQQVADSVAVAAAFYNQYGSFNKHWDVHYDAGIPTAQGGYNGYMGYGGTRNERVVFHEASHTFGMGTTSAYANLISGGVWKGKYGNQAQLDTYNSYSDGLHGDSHAIWPGGFNYDSEDGTVQRHWHTRVMAGIRADMGILSFTREARNEVAVTGGIAEFSVESPVAASFQWYKDGVALTNGGDISGANTATLRIVNADTADQGSYRCAATGAGETLNSRPRQLWVQPEGLLGQWDLDGTTTDATGANSGTAYGSPSYTTGKFGQAIDLDGSNDYIDLPDGVGVARELTVATWVNWDGGSNWQRVFDFGSGTNQSLFLTPQFGGGMRLVYKDVLNGLGSERLITTTALPVGQWVHLAAVLRDDYLTFYVNGAAVGSAFGIRSSLCDFPATNNYIGKSQYPDPLFNGRIDDFRVYNHALDGSEVWDLWGQNANNAPVFVSDPVTMPDAAIASAYSGQSLASHASDADLDTLTFAKLDGPAWLAVASDGSLSGTPDAGDLGLNAFTVRVTDPSGASSDAGLLISVGYSPTSPVAYWTFEEGTADTYVLGPATSGQYDGSILDVSGNGNHLSAYAGNWEWYRSQAPGATTPLTGAPNSISIQNANSWPSISAIGTALTEWSPTEWTIEAAIRPDDATNGFQTFIGRDSKGAYSGDPALAALYFSVNPDGALRIQFTDAAGNNWLLTSAANAVQDLKWHAVAASSDGNTLALYLKNITDGDTDYTLLGTLDISSSSNPALTPGAGAGSGWNAGVFTVSRGLYNGGHADRFFGHLDDIRLYGRALNASEFLYSYPGDALSPAAPAALVAVAGDGAVDLDWADNAEPDLASYTVYRSTTSGSGYAVIASGLTGSAYTDNTSANGTTYYYEVTATDTSSNESVSSAEVSATPMAQDTTPPAVPTGLAANSGDNNVDLDWADNSEPDFASYTVYRSTTSGSGYAPVASGLAASAYSDNTASNGTTYYYVVTASDTAANESANSGQVSAMPTAPPDTTPPAAPTNLAASAGDNSVSLDWADNSEPDLASYTVYRSTASGSGYDPVASSLAASAYTDNTAVNGTTYYYVVTATDTSSNQSASSNQATATPALPVPGAPTNLAATAASISEIDLGWNAASGADTYTVKWSATPGGPYTVLQSGLTGISHSDTNVLANSTVYYVVSATNAGGESPNSNEASATTPELVADLPLDETTGITSVDQSPNGFDATLVGGASWAAGLVGNGLSLDGINGHATLPAGVVSHVGDCTISTWVYLDTVSTWSRIFDFGTGTSVNMFLTPKSGSGAVRFAITASGAAGEQQINGTAPLPGGVWTHVAVTVSGGVGRLYVDGTETGSNSAMTLEPASLGNTTLNYIGRSQYPDPYLDGTFDDFQIIGRALTATEISDIVAAGQSGGWTELAFDDFEAGLGNYTDGGADCARLSSANSPQGTWSMNIQDNSGTSSSFWLTNGIDVATPGYTEIKVDFSFRTASMENGEDFWVQYFNGSTWQTVASYATPAAFVNGTVYDVSVSIPESTYNFPANMQIRFMCDASGNRDDVYIDEVRISAK